MMDGEEIYLFLFVKNGDGLLTTDDDDGWWMADGRWWIMMPSEQWICLDLENLVSGSLLKADQ